MSNESGSDGSFDLTQFHGVFFDEAAEHLEAMESLLLGIDITCADDEQLNAIFRAAHSIKGGAATFGFKEITDLTHEMETVFDKVRKHEMAPTVELVDLFLASSDALKAMLAQRKGQGDGIAADAVTALCHQLRQILDPTRAAGAAPVDADSKNAAPASKHRYALEIVFGPFDEKCPAASIDGVLVDLAGFGDVHEITPTAATMQDGKPKKGKRTSRNGGPAERRIRIDTDSSVEEMTDALAFMFEADRVKVRLIDPPATDSVAVETPAAPAPTVAPAPRDEPTPEDGFGLFVDPSTLPANTTAPAVPAPIASITPKAAPRPAAAPSPDAASIRVSVDKVDQLINLVGELVITQAMLAQTASTSDPVLYEALFNGLATLERNTRDLQEAAMSIRMMPMSFVFSRFPRVVRDTAAKLGKEVDLQTTGESTELDKGLIERVTDPLTHLIRNSLDHGLESPEEREAKGKPRRGTIALRAYHQGGAIVIEVSDDGRGLRRDKILSKARERGMEVSDAMSDQEVWQLIFEAGFSTADQVTDVSGRGVGMDVVRRNIQEMGGRVEIESTADVGTNIAIKLPLTLAILDGMSVRIGEEIFILPLTCISESLQPSPESLSTLAGRGLVVEVRGDYLPVVSLADVFNLRATATRPAEGVLVILEIENRRTALVVDALVGQHQVVIKSLETNFRKVAGISGATIMGDGRVAMILDAAHIVGSVHSRLQKAA